MWSTKWLRKPLKDDAHYRGYIQHSCLVFLFTLVKIIHLHKYLQATEKDTVLSLYGWSFQGLCNSFFHADISGVSLKIKAEKILRLSHWLACSAKPCCLQKHLNLSRRQSQPFVLPLAFQRQFFHVDAPLFAQPPSSLPFQQPICRNCFFPYLPCQNNFSPIFPGKELTRRQLIYNQEQ